MDQIALFKTIDFSCWKTVCQSCHDSNVCTAVI